MAAPHDLLRKLGRFVDGLTDHEGGELDLMLVHQVEDPRDALVYAVLEDAIGREVRQTIFHGFLDKAGGARDRLSPGLEHEGEADGETRAVGPVVIACCGHTALLLND